MLDIEKLIAGVHEYIGRALAPLALRVKALEQRAAVPGPAGERGQEGTAGPAGKDGAPGPRGEPGLAGAPGEKGVDGGPGRDGAAGRDGRDGKDGAPGERGPQGERGETGAKGLDGAPGPQGEKGLDGQPGRDGKDGRDGIDGKDGAPGLQGKEGAAGKDGRDGFSLDDFGAELKDGGRILVLSLRAGERTVSRELKMPTMIHRGVYRAGEYQEGDCVTFAGSTWHAVQDTKEAPGGKSTHWRLIVKRGADGKDASRGDDE